MLKRKFILLSLILTIGALFSQSQMSPVFMGSSLSNGMLLRNLDAVGYNPANMALSGNHDYSINFFPVATSVEATFKKEIYDTYFAKGGDNSFSPADINAILGELDDFGYLRVSNKTKVGLIGFSLGNEAYNLNVNTVQDVKISKDFLEQAIIGEEIGVEYIYDDDDLSAEHYQYTSLEYTFSEKMDFLIFNKIFEEITIGATFRYMFGFPGPDMDTFGNPAYLKTTNVDGYFIANEVNGSSSVDTGATKFIGTVDVLKSEAGHGIGVDLGTAVKLNKDITIGLSVNNIISGISWYQNNKVYRYNVEMDGLFLNQLDKLDEAITDLDTTYTVNKIFTSIPSELNIGFAWNFDYENGQKVVWTAGHNQGFTYDQFSTMMPKFSTGISYSPIDWFTLRSGITGGGNSYFESAIGFSLEFKYYAFDLGIEDKFLYGQGSKGLGIAIGQKFYW